MTINKRVLFFGVVGAILTQAVLCTNLQADDTEVFISPKEAVAPNVLFLLDNSGSMRKVVWGDPKSRSRLQVLKDSLNEVLSTIDSNVNIGLMRFSGTDSATERGVSFPVAPLSENATTILSRNGLFDINTDNLPNPELPTLSVRDYLQQVINSWSASNYTPLVGSMTEAMQYYKGQEPVYGYATPTTERAAHPATYAGGPIASQSETTRVRYQSPIVDECQSNYLVVLSDGEPKDSLATISNRQDRLQSLLGLNSCQSFSNANITADEYNYGKCGYEIAQHLATTDLLPNVEGDQHVQTYTIGFGLKYNKTAQEYLKIVANAGEGGFYVADSAAELAKTFNDLLNTFTEQAEVAFASPSYSVNTENGLSHDQQIYIPITVPNYDRPRWQGNVKKFTLKNGEVVNPAGDALIDQDGNIDTSSNDIWGQHALDGEPDGMVSLLEPSKRNLLVNTSDKKLDELKISNDKITKELLQVDTDRQREQVLDYLRGYDISPLSTENCTDKDDDDVVDTGLCEKRDAIGDILHSRPVLVSYDDTKQSESYLFFGTNEGFLHAVNAETGKEEFAFMPKELLKNGVILFNNSSQDAHPYGVDGEITVWRDDKNRDGKIDHKKGDRVYLYFGLRRGGRSYFALDVTKPKAPKLLWQIEGGKDKDFKEMGQTWSKPTLAKIKYEDTKKKGKTKFKEEFVMIVGGGYDPVNGDQETRTLRNQAGGEESHTQGRAIYIIKAKDGKLIKSFTHEDDTRMDYSIVGDIRLMDMNGDNYLDRLYFADVGGQIWRVDLFADPEKQKDLKRSRLTLLATLGEENYGSSVDSRKFFFEPDVSVYRENGKDTVLIALGSGYLARPLSNAITDGLFVIKDPYAYEIPPKDAPVLQLQDLTDARNEQVDQTFTSGKGWYLLFTNTGEKVLSSPYIFLNKVFFSTLISGSLAPVGGDPCKQEASHTSRVYGISLFDGSAVIDFDGDDSKERFVKINEKLIPDTPSITFRKPVCDTGKKCHQIIDLKVGIGKSVLSSKNAAAPTEGTMQKFDLGGLLPKTYWINHNKF